MPRLDMSFWSGSQWYEKYNAYLKFAARLSPQSAMGSQHKLRVVPLFKTPRLVAQAHTHATP